MDIYDSVRLISYFEQKQVKCVIPMSETIRQGVRNAYRKFVKSRYKVEQLFGNMKMA
ncbi:MAG: hypothetical protein N3D14_02385 [Aquificaceae bacterium]|nr:hypothetical protein [Aquificaceae bacterium]